MEIAAKKTKAIASNSVWSPSFQALLWTNWLTSINDNVFRWFVIGVGKDFWEPKDHSLLLTIGSIAFVLPYIVFASIAGWLADRFSKRNVIVACKIAEIVIMTLGVLAVVGQSMYLLFAAVFCMGAQSALFAPSKVGTIPELLDEKTISAGNGIFNLATLSATVIGMALGGWLANFSGFKGQDHILVTTGVLVGIAIVGTILSFFIRSLPAANKSARFPITIIGDTIYEIYQLVRSGPLFAVALGIVFFWSIAALAQINIDVFSEESGGFLETHRTPMLVSLVLGVGIGSVLAGFISGGRIELGLVPYGAAGIALFAILLYFCPGNFIDEYVFNSKKILACGLLGGLGISAGFFDVPLAAYLQHKSPIQTRGKILAATNCLLFCGAMGMFLLFSYARTPSTPGAFANLPETMQGTELSKEDQARIEQVRKSFLVEFDKTSTDNRPEITTYLAAFEGTPAREPALAGLMWDDMKKRQEIDEKLHVETYRSAFPDDRRVIKNVLLQSDKLPWMSSRMIFLLIGLATIPVVAVATWKLPQKMARLGFWALFHILYRTRVRGLEKIPSEGGVVLVFNHSSWLDGAIMLSLIPRRLRPIAWGGNFKHWAPKLWAKFCGVILISAGPKSIRRGLEEAAETLRQGGIVGIFPEGGISRSGQIRTFKPGMMKIIKDMDVPVIPCFIDETWGTIFSYERGKAIWKFPNSFRHPLSLHIGDPIHSPESPWHVRQQMQRLSADAVEHRAGKFRSPTKLMVRQCKQRRFKPKIADSSGQQETGGSLLTRALVLRRLLRQHVLGKDEEMVGVLIPPSNGGVIVNLALSLDKRVAVNLNYSLSPELINSCIKEAGIKHVLTSQKVMDKFGFELDANVFMLDELKEKVTSLDKAVGAFQSYALPAFALNSWLGLNRVKPDDVMTIIFTSGSTGTPKGVMLTHRNVASNMDGIERCAAFAPTDAMVGILPFFHSFGYTATLWAAMGCNIRGLYHFSPLDARQVGKLTERHKGTILVATPTFLRSYMKRCTKEQFATLDMVVAGAERLPPELCDQFEEKFGVRPVEGYGATELSPIVCVNIPGSRDHDKFQVDCKEGTVGRVLPNCATKVLDLDSGQELGPNESGMLWIKGPNVMKGYLNRKDLTDDVIVDGWYKSGDVALVDDDGFVKITGRISRFSKIGGEMVPHVKIEEILSKICDPTPNDDSDDDQPRVAVTAVPDEKKGERLIVLHTEIPVSVEEMRAALSDEGLPNIFIPSADSFRLIEQIPVLGTGKVDLKGLKLLAEELFIGETAE